ncbi:MAG: 5-(carboxyamino)imidazole ribonucleotide mutase [Thermoplasmata archaeon]
MEVTVIAGSTSDKDFVIECVKTLKELGITYDVKFLSAHRNPEILMEEIKKSDSNIFIAIAGMAAALPGFIASITHKPVIGVPLSGKVPYDSILSILQLPKGIPVATVGVDNVKNAALLAARIISVYNKDVENNLLEYIKREKEKNYKDGKNLAEELIKNV